MFSLSLWPAALLTSQRGNSVGHFPFVHFRRGYERGLEREQGQKLRECANKYPAASLSARDVGDISSIKNLCMEQRIGERKPPN